MSYQATVTVHSSLLETLTDLVSPLADMLAKDVGFTDIDAAVACVTSIPVETI
jgi:hypothetical protein